jgi:hypothetical protein
MEAAWAAPMGIGDARGRANGRQFSVASGSKATLQACLLFTGARLMDRDKLIIIKPDFADPAFPGARFYCWHCALMEGVLASFPELGERIDVVRIDWARPRREVIAAIGEANQSLPVLILADDADDFPATGEFEGKRFVHGKDAILAALSQRHGIPDPHP